MNDNSFLTFIRNNWFINLFLIDIPHDIQCLFQLGQNFSFSSNVKNNTIELIKNIENNSKKLNIDIQSNIRNLSIPIVRNLFLISTHKNNINAKLSSLFKLTKRFIKNHPSIIFNKSRQRQYYGSFG